MRAKSRGRRLLSILLSCMLLLSLIPTAAFAATTYVSLSVSVENAAATGGKVQIGSGSQGTAVTEGDIIPYETRTVNIYPAAGYELDSVTVNGTADTTVSNNKLELTMDVDKTVVVKFKQSSAAAADSTSFKVLKTDASNTQTKLKGAHFVLSEQGQGTGRYTAVSDSDGIAAFTNIPDGTYTLYEHLAPYGYLASADEYTVTINTNNPTAAGADPITIVKQNAPVGTAAATYQDGAVIATFVNAEDDNTVGISLPITKIVNGDNAPAEQKFQFELLRIIGETDQGEPIFEVIETTNPRKSQFTEAFWVPKNQLSSLAIREKQETIQDWTFDETVYYVNINQDNTDNFGNYEATYTKLGDQSGTSYSRAEFTNTYAKGDKTVSVSFPITKTVNGDNAPAEQKFQFELLRITGEDNQGEPIFEVIGTTSPNRSKFSEVHQISVNESTQGSIAIREKKEDIAGWTFDETVYYVDINQNKTDGLGNYVATYTKLGDQSGTSFERAEFTNTYAAYGMDGIAHWPSGTPQNKEDHEDNNGDGLCDICDFNMAAAITSFSVKKTDEAGEALPDAEFMLAETGQGHDEFTATSDSNGLVDFIDIPNGRYVLYERSAPYGYLLSDDRYNVTIDSTATDPITIEHTQATVGTAPSTHADGATVATFVNKKDTMVQIKLPYKKTVTGDYAPASQTFRFELLRIVGEDDNGEPIFDVIDTSDAVTSGAYEWEKEFPESELGNLALAIREKQEDLTGWTFDETVYLIYADTNKADQSGNVVATYAKFDDPSGSSYTTAEFTNAYAAYGMDGIWHWPVNDPTNKEKHLDNDGDGHCDKCDYDMSGNNGDNGNKGNNDKKGTIDKKGSISKKSNLYTGVSAPRTGDNSNMLLWIALILASGLGIIGTALYRRRKRTTK